MPNTLYYGDNLDILRQHVPNESVDLIYLDPPFHSNASYKVLFKKQDRHVGVNPASRMGRVIWSSGIASVRMKP